MSLERKIEKSLKGNGIFLTFDGVLWRDEDQAIRSDPRVDFEDAEFIEVSRKQMIQLLAAALRNDLC